MSVANPNQHTDEWWLARRGKITASRMRIVMDGGVRAWQTLADRLSAERLMEGMPKEPEVFAPALKHGIRWEPIARTNAELHLDADFALCGFVPHPTFDFIGASPDGRWYGRPVEVKCPYNLQKHMEVYRTQEMPAEHMPQVQCQIEVCEADSGIFVSYSPEPHHWKMRCVVLQIMRDQSYIDQMLDRCQQFKAHVMDHEPLVRSLSTVKTFF